MTVVHRRPIILRLLWQIISLHLMKPSLDAYDQRAVREVYGETSPSTPEDALIPWINYHLKQSGSDAVVSRIGDDKVSPAVCCSSAFEACVMCCTSVLM